MDDDLHALVPGSPTLAPTGSGRLDAVDVAVKDLFAVKGHTASFGHPRWRETHGPAKATSPTITRLREQGARIVGLAKLDQLAFSLTGNAGEGEAPANPRNPRYHCGGSSSGSASAVAGSRAQLGIGTDTAGSVRVPAALCGIHGLRPTWGRLDPAGTIGLAPSFDTVGLLAANPQTMRAGFATLAGGPPTVAAPPLHRVLVAPSVTAELPEATRAAVHAAATEVAEALGTGVTTVEASRLVAPEVGELFGRLQGREVWATHGDWVSRHIDALDDDVALRLRRCRAFATEPEADISADRSDHRRYREQLAGIVTPGTVLVLPVLGAAGPRLSDDRSALALFRRQCFRLQAPASLGGLPQLSWTRPAAPDGRAVGPEATSVGLLGPPGADEILIDLLGRLAGT